MATLSLSALPTWQRWARAVLCVVSAWCASLLYVSCLRLWSLPYAMLPCGIASPAPINLMIYEACLCLVLMTLNINNSTFKRDPEPACFFPAPILDVSIISLALYPQREAVNMVRSGLSCSEPSCSSISLPVKVRALTTAHNVPHNWPCHLSFCLSCFSSARHSSQQQWSSSYLVFQDYCTCSLCWKHCP